MNNSFGTWSSGANIPSIMGRNSNGAIVSDNKIYVVHYNDIYVYDLEANLWSALEKPAGTREHSCAMVDNRIYCLGGSPDYSGAVNTSKIYDIETDEWSVGPLLPVPRRDHRCVAYGKKIYCFGGYSGGGAGTIYDRVDILNTEDGTWSSGSPIPTRRSAFGCTLVGSRVYIMGGYSTTSSRTKANECYDILTDTWEAESELPMEAGHCSAGAIGSYIYLPVGDGSTDFLIYDTVNKVWHEGPPSPVAHTYASVVAADGKLYAIGGESITDLNIYTPNIVISPADHQLRLLLERGESQQLAGILLPSGITVEEVDWSSADPSIVQVDENGLATGVQVGKAVVTVTAKNGSWSDSILIQVLEAEVEPEYRLSILLKTGETCRLAVSDDPEEMFLWTSDDTDVATVSDTGKVTAIAPGVTIITVTSEDGAFEDRVCVKVED